MSRSIHYVSEKISKIRWRPSTLSEPNSFVTAGWGNPRNNIRLWEVWPKQTINEIEIENEADVEDINPVEIRDITLKGDITDLKFLSSDGSVVSTSLGNVYLFKICSNDQFETDIAPEISWESLHTLPNATECCCTSFAVYDSDIASVGEDGCINLLSINHQKPTGKIANADSCTIQCVEFLRHNELLTANTRGLFKIWDVRNNSNEAAQSFLLRNDIIAMPTCIAHHPTQRHIVVTGDDTGMLTVWDLRQNTLPLNALQQHKEAVNEIVFHPDRPDQLFTCAGGDVFHWTGLKQSDTLANPLWYTLPSTTNKFDIFRLLPELHVPVRSIDLSRNKMLCGADNEAFYIIPDIDVYNSYEREAI